MTPTFDTDLVQAAAGTLIHLLWQGALIAAVLAIALELLRKRSSEARYAVAVAALLSFGVAGIVTFTMLRTDGGAPPPLASETVSVEPVIAASEMFSPRAWVRGEPAAGLGNVLERLVESAAPTLVTIWFAGVLFFSIRLIYGYRTILALVRDAREDLESEWNLALRRLSGRIRLTPSVALLHSASVEVPTVIGWLRPTILVPLAAVSGLSTRQLEMILAHEIAHIRRHDFLVNLLQNLIETLFFYHPAVWWISRQVRIEREHCCDDLAVAFCGDPLQYAHALTGLEQLRALAEPSVAATGGSLLGRIRRLVGGDASPHVVPGWFAGLAAVTLVAVATLAAPVTNTDDPSARPFSYSPSSHLLAAIASFSPLSGGGGGQADPETLILTSDSDRTGTHSAMIQGIEGGIAGGMGAASMRSAVKQGVAGAFAIGDPVTMIASAQEVVEVRGEPSDSMDVEALIRLRSVGVDGDYIRQMKAVGYDLSLSELVALKSVGVSPAYVEAMKKAGYADLDASEIQAMRAVGISTAWLDEMRAAGISDLDPDDLISLRALGVSPAYVREVRRLFGENLDAEDIAQLRAVGVTSEWVAEMKKVGLLTEGFEDAVEMRAVGLTPEYVKALRAAGYTTAEPDEIVSARAVGVSIEYLESLSRLGIRAGDLDDLVSLRAVGVTPEWIHEMRESGYPSLTADEMQELRAVGVTAAWIREMKNAGLTRLSVDDLVQLRASGVDAAFILGLKKKN